MNIQRMQHQLQARCKPISSIQSGPKAKFKCWNKHNALLQQTKFLTQYDTNAYCIYTEWAKSFTFKSQSVQYILFHDNQLITNYEQML